MTDKISSDFSITCRRPLLLARPPRPTMILDLRESMTEADIEIVLQGAKEKYPEARRRIGCQRSRPVIS